MMKPGEPGSSKAEVLSAGSTEDEIPPKKKMRKKTKSDKKLKEKQEEKAEASTSEVTKPLKKGPPKANVAKLPETTTEDKTAENTEQTSNDNFLQEGRAQLKIEDYSHNDLIDIVLDEVSLEGLDGITIEALWTRIADRISENLPFSVELKNTIWEILMMSEKIKFYLLPKPRGKLIVFNRFKYVDWDTGHITEPDEIPEDIYQFSPISEQDAQGEYLGSCAHFKSRVNISEEIRQMIWDKAEEKYDLRLVIVADQLLRNKALGLEHAKSLDQLSNVHYCILERIGRSRKLGEVTVGRNSLIQLSDSKNLFYLRKTLLANGLITKQSFCMRFHKSGNTSALLFHLRRFYSEYKSVKTNLTEQIIDILKRKPDNRIEYLELKKLLGQEAWSKGVQKLLKSAEFRQYVQTDLLVPYRTMYPNASQKEWKLKNGPREKNLRIIQLINPRINLSTASKEEEVKDESSDDEPLGEFALNFSIFNQTYKMVSESGSEGLSLKQVQRKLGLDFYIIRSVLSNMLKKNMIETKNVDVGRIHILKYYVHTSNEESAGPKTTSQEIPTTSSSEADDEALSFIADVLEVDKSELVPKDQDDVNQIEMDTESEDCNPFKGHFDYIREYRTKIRLEKYIQKSKPSLQADKDERSDSEKKQRAEEREKFDAIFKNDHPYYPIELSLEHKRIRPLRLDIKVDDEFMKMFKASNELHAIEKSQIDYDYFDKCEDISLDARTLEEINSVRCPLKINILLGSSEKSSHIIQKYLFLPITITVDDLLKRFHTLLDDIRNKSSSHKLEYIDDLASEDEVYFNSENKDNLSLNVNLEEVKEEENLTRKEDVEVTEFKTQLIKDFQKLACSFTKDSDVFPVIRSQCEEKDKKRKLEEPQEKNAKKAKLESESDGNITEKEKDETHIPKDTKMLLKRISGMVKMDVYLGQDPVLLSHCLDDDNIETTIISTKTAETVPTSETYTNKALAQRSVSRANFILETVYRDKVISDIPKLIGAIRTIEKGKRLLGVVDRKSVDRLLHYLVLDGHIKIYKIILKYENVLRCKNIVCLFSLDATHTLQVFIDQLKMVFFIYAKKKTDSKRQRISTAEHSDLDAPPPDSYDEIVALTSNQHRPKYKHSRTIARQYGYVPKFAKVKIMHELLFYLMYSYDGQAVSTEDVPSLLKRFHVKVNPDNIKNLGTIYKRELSWKMFIPPLPKYKNWPSGWALICDVILRLPLSVFVKIFNIAYVIPDLVPLLNDPVRKHLLLKYIPADIRNACLHNRKCIFSIHEILCHLCYIGLLQFGVQKLKEKDQQFIYLNRRAILYDTTSSESGYHEVTKKEYPVLQFYFENQAVLDNYWSKMWNISLNTKLGQRYTLLQKTITLQDIHAKPEMIQSARPKSPEVAVEADVGYIPGDRLGACCFDSSTWVHVKRNWIWSNSVRKTAKTEAPTINPVVGLRRKHLDQVKVKSIKYKDLPRELNKKKLKKASLQTESRIEMKTVPKKSKKLPMTRKVLPRPPSKIVKALKYDDLDKRIMKKMGKSRAIWSEDEDVNMLICHFAKKFLTFNTNKKVVSALIIRDVMHRLCPNKRKKTTLAYARRCQKLLKSDKGHGNERYSYHLESDKYLQKIFSKFRTRIADGESIADAHVNIAFIYLVKYIANTYKKKFLNQQRTLDDDSYFDYLNTEDIPKYFKQDVKNPDIIYLDPQTIDEIKVDVIKDIVHCSLGWKSDSSELPLILYRAYQHYPDSQLREALSWLRKHQIIAGKKISTKHGNIKDGIHMAGKLIHNSFVYSFKQITSYPDYIYPEAYQMLVGIYRNHKKDREFLGERFEQGHGLGLSEIASLHDVLFTFKIPDDLLVLDPKIADHSQLIQELAVRYKFLIHQKKNLLEGDEQEKTTSTSSDDLDGVEKAIEVIFESQKQKSSKSKEVSPESSNLLSNQKDEVRLTDTSHSSEQKESSEQDKDIAKLDATNIQKLPRSDTGFDNSETTIKALQDLTSYLGSKQGDESVKVSDLAYLLTKGLFPELDDDEERLEKLNKHFLIMYPSPTFNIPDTLSGKPWAEEIFSNGRNKGEEIQEMVKNECIVKNTSHDEEVSNNLIDLGGDDEDITLAFAIVNYIKQKKVFGTSTAELRKEFLSKTQNLDLHEIVTVLIKIGLIFRTGVTNIRLVHVSENEMWTVGLDDERPISEINLNSLGMRLKLMPWVRINGTLNLKVLHNWMYVILSYCLSHPFAMLSTLMKRFNILKPVDIFSLLEYLQALNCLRIYTYMELKPITLLSNFGVSSKRQVNILDDFETIFVETDKAAIIKMGAFRYKGQTDIDIPFEE